LCFFIEDIPFEKIKLMLMMTQYTYNYQRVRMCHRIMNWKDIFSTSEATPRVILHHRYVGEMTLESVTIFTVNEVLNVSTECLFNLSNSQHRTVHCANFMFYFLQHLLKFRATFCHSTFCNVFRCCWCVGTYHIWVRFKLFIWSLLWKKA
jgi:hypothetical protein